MSDSADARVDWPRFKLAHFSAPTGIPHGWDAELLAKGAPDGLAYHVEDKLTLLEDPGSGPLVCFGSSGLNERLCLNPHTKQVVCISYGAFKIGDSQPEVVGPAEMVGSSLDHFIALVRAATERFPFDSDLTGEDRRGAALRGVGPGGVGPVGDPGSHRPGGVCDSGRVLVLIRG